MQLCLAPMQNDSDHELLRRYAETGSQAAFSELVSRYLRLVRRASRRLAPDAGEAEDITQDVFLALSRKAGSINPNVILKAWLLNATSYAARSDRRRRQRRKMHETAAARQKLFNFAFDDLSELSDSERIERHRLLHLAMESLSTITRHAISQRFLGNRTYADIGTDLGLGEEAVRQRVHRGLRRLRRLLSTHDRQF